MRISAHILLKNEYKFCWYSIMSVIRYIDVIRIWDTGSMDGTLQIINEISKTREAKDKDLFDFRKFRRRFDEAEIRQEMLREELKSGVDWVLIIDADEIWWDLSIKRLVDAIKNGPDMESIVVPTYSLVGDMFHYQEEAAGRYNLAGRVGHLALRAFNLKIPGLIAQGEHGVFGWFDEKGERIERRDSSKMLFLEAPYLHATHLRRSAGIYDNAVFKRAKKLKYEIGQEFPLDFYFPEIFFRPRPERIESPWLIPDIRYNFIAFFETPLRKIYRRTLLPLKKHGY